MASLKNIMRAFGDVTRRRRAILRRRPGVIHVGQRAHGRRVRQGKTALFRKTHEDPAALAREIDALNHFAGKPWAPALLGQGEDHLLLPLYPAERRLDQVVATADADTRAQIARSAIAMLFDIFLANRAHRDVHARNLFWVDEQVVAVDFECMTTYPAGSRPSFAESYDITGQGLPSPHATLNMSWERNTPSRMALKFVLGIDAAQALDMLRQTLREELREASLSFNKRGARHTCRSGMIYASFDLPHLHITADEAQRDTVKRWHRFGLAESQLRQARVLDLGCNTGAILFHTASLNPGQCVGVEYDQAKVDIANRISAFNGLTTHRFIQADLDRTDPNALGEPFDIVFCLAIEAHLKNKDALYKVLASCCRGTLLFEGNSTTDMTEVVRRLQEIGFDRIERLGTCDDDRRPENNTRELIKACKRV